MCFFLFPVLVFFFSYSSSIPCSLCVQHTKTKKIFKLILIFTYWLILFCGCIHSSLFICFNQLTFNSTCILLVFLFACILCVPLLLFFCSHLLPVQRTIGAKENEHWIYFQGYWLPVIDWYTLVPWQLSCEWMLQGNEISFSRASCFHPFIISEETRTTY